MACDKDEDTPHAFTFQRLDRSVDKLATDTLATMRRFDCEMIKESAPTIVTAKDGAHDMSSGCRHVTHARITR
jgi:hypothetical protein